MPILTELLATLPQTGTVEWIGLRPGRRLPVDVVTTVAASADGGLEGDRYGKAGGRRQVTLIQAEHLEAVASMLGIDELDPARVRRNVVVRGINLRALKDRRFRIGDAVLEHTGECHPCSRMEEELGPGGYNTMRGHGGITATVIEGGAITVGDPVAVDTPR